MAHDWDDDLDRAMEGIRRKAKAWEDTELARMETMLNRTTPPAIYGDVPPPGYCHPAHEQHRSFILDWLDETGVGGYFLNLPVPRAPRLSFNPAPDPAEFQPPRVLTMRKRRAWAPAPYVGRPYVYWWWTGVDDHGRGAGSANTHRAYTDGGPQ